MSEQPKLPEDIKTAWLEKLRSGEYKQCSGLLHHITLDSYCCIGVLCTVLDPDAVVPSRSLSVVPRDWKGVKKLPREVNALTSDELLSFGELAQLNDSGKNFLEIADLIEAKL